MMNFPLFLAPHPLEMGGGEQLRNYSIFLMFCCVNTERDHSQENKGDVIIGDNTVA